jgi:hypothetical protein
LQSFGFVVPQMIFFDAVNTIVLQSNLQANFGSIVLMRLRINIVFSGGRKYEGSVTRVL